MIRKPAHILRALGLALVVSAGSAHADGLAQLKQFMDGTRTARGTFSQQVYSKSGRKPQQASGTFAFSRPGKFRWQIDKPYSQLLVGDGEKIWMYDPDLRQVTVKKMDAALGSTPAALLVGGNSLEKSFTLRELGEREGMEWLEATPKSPDSGFEKLHLGFAGEDLKAMELFDNFGQTTSLAFSNVQRNPSLPAAIFRFVPPAGADVIGE